MDIGIPCGTQAFVHIPASRRQEKIYCNDVLVWDENFVNCNHEIAGVANDDQFVVFDLDHGEYHFIADQGLLSEQKYAPQRKQHSY
jgi:hypothetical protein